MRRLTLPFLALLTVGGTVPGGRAADAPPAENVENRYEAAIRRFESRDQVNPPPSGTALFLGSSSITRWRSLAEDFPGIDVLNRGFGGAEFSDVLHFFDRVVTPYAPRVIVIYAGSHDLRGPGGGPEEVLRMFRTFCAAVQAKFPETKVCYVSMKPSLAKWSSIHLDREANRLIAEYAAGEPRVEFIDIWTPMTADGEPPPAKYFAEDRNHPSRAAYTLWAAVIRPYIE
jgi:lysophospholipase L1-like esterase